MLEIAEAVAPMATKSFRDHLLGGVRFSARELDALNALLGIEAGAPVLPETITARLDEMGMKDREKQRLIAKLSERRQM
jgi:hypothetical protein